MSKITNHEKRWLEEALIGLRVPEESYYDVLRGLMIVSGKFEANCVDFDYERVYLKDYEEKEIWDDCYVCSIEARPLLMKYDEKAGDFIEVKEDDDTKEFIVITGLIFP